MKEPIPGLDAQIDYAIKISIMLQYTAGKQYRGLAGCCGAISGQPMERNSIKGINLFLLDTPEKVDLGFSLEKDELTYWIEYNVYPYMGRYLHVVTKSCDRPSRRAYNDFIFADGAGLHKILKPNEEIYAATINALPVYFGDGVSTGVYSSLGTIPIELISNARTKPSAEVFEYCMQRFLYAMRGKTVIFIKKDVCKGNNIFDKYIAEHITYSSPKFFNVPYFENYSNNYLQLHLVEVE